MSASSGSTAAPQVGETREAMFARIRGALAGRAEGTPSPPKVEESLARLCDQAADLVARFETQATAVGLRVQCVSPERVVETVASLLSTLPKNGVAVDVEDGEVAGWVEAAIEAVGGERLDWQSGGSLAAHFRSDVAITDVDAAIADSGSLILSSSPQRSRAAHLLAPVHVAIVRTSQVQPDHVDFWHSSRPIRDSAATVLITGPSKTADIEGVLVTGVHGPGTVYVLLVE